MSRQPGGRLGREIVEDLRRLRAVMERGDRLEDHVVVRRYLVRLEPPRFSAAAVRGVRKRLGMSQAVFARILAVSPATVRAWERLGARSPMARRLLEVIEPWWAHVNRPAQASPRGRRAG